MRPMIKKLESRTRPCSSPSCTALGRPGPRSTRRKPRRQSRTTSRSTPRLSRRSRARFLTPEGSRLRECVICGIYGVALRGRRRKKTIGSRSAALRPSKPRTLSRLVKIRDPDALGAFLVPEESRPVLFVHRGKKLAGYTEVGWETPEPIGVRLEPWGVVTGRLVDSAGLPRANFGMQPHMILKNRLRQTEVPHWQERVFTDSTGRFRVEGLAPGRNYRLVYEDASGNQTAAGRDVAPLKPGETRDLGDIKAVVPGEAD